MKDKLTLDWTVPHSVEGTLCTLEYFSVFSAAQTCSYIRICTYKLLGLVLL